MIYWCFAFLSAIYMEMVGAHRGGGKSKIRPQFRDAGSFSALADQIGGKSDLSTAHNSLIVLG
jgi:hypothetical protein